MEKITILGCGRWASCHAWYQSIKLGNDVLMWGRAGDPIFEDIIKTKKNKYMEMPKTVSYSSDLKYSIDFANIFVIAITAQAMQDFSAKIGECKPKNKIFILAMKGIDQNTGERLSQILRKHIDDSNHICVWVGPGHTQELTSGQPNVMIVAGDNEKITTEIVSKFSTTSISLYQSDDLIGVEIGAAAKNVIGIAAGFLDGMGVPSLKGPLMARACYEVSLLIMKMGGDKMTAFGLSHLGDFEATLFSQSGHNRKYGELFIRGESTNEIGTAEGVATTKAIYDLSQKFGINMPITTTIYRILYENANKEESLNKLLNNANKREFRYE